MKTSPHFFIRTIVVLILFTFFLNGVSFTQPPGMPPCAPSASPGETACSATPICNLDGYCGRTLSTYTADVWTILKNAIITCSSNGWDQLDVNNDSYLKFVAGSNSISFDVYVYNCLKPVTTKAIQLAIFSADNCGSGAVDVKYCNRQMNQQNTPHNVTMNNLTPGETYYILIDGYSSQDCAYSFVATSGVNVGLSVNLSQTTICPGESVTATASGGSGSYTWSGDSGLGTSSGSTVTITPPTTPGVYNYNVQSSGTTGGDIICPTSNDYDFSITVSNGSTPTFNQLGPFCAGDNFTLPGTSLENINGTWSPAINNTQTTTYTFTPNPTSGQCAGTATMTVSINNQVTPSFNNPGPVCSGTSFTLPTTSNNGVVGAWSPAINNTQTTTYTFTPSNAGCAAPVTMTVVIDNQVTPVFTNPGPVCSGTSFTLPTTSNNGVAGSWSPAINNTQTTTYTFTPTNSGCAAPVTMTVVIDNQVTPVFTNPGPVCSGTSFTLPATSNNGVAGSWSPAINNTATTTYTFTPATGSGSCAATPVTMEVIVNPTPVASAQGDTICSGDTTNVVLQSNIPGTSFTWTATSLNASGASDDSGSEIHQVLHSSNGGNVVYAITPVAGGCSGNPVIITVFISSTLPITVTPNISICQGDSVTLTASGGTSYTWSPSTGLNTSTGSTVIASPLVTTTYSVTGVSASGCVGTNSVTVTVLPQPVADFTPSTTTGTAPLEVLFENTSVNATNYIWNFGNGLSSSSSNSTVSTIYHEGGTYEVILIASNGVCADTASAIIIVIASDLIIYVPNVFTPNNDLVNDVFYIGTTHAKTVHVEILNRWGNIIARLEKSTDVWDGGTSPNGVYFYNYKITDLTDKLYEGSGFFHLERGKQ